MTDNKLSNLNILCVESERKKSLDIDKFVRVFSSQHMITRIQWI